MGNLKLRTLFSFDLLIKTIDGVVNLPDLCVQNLLHHQHTRQNQIDFLQLFHGNGSFFIAAIFTQHSFYG